MSEVSPEPRPVQPPRKRGSGVAIVAIVGATIIALACIAAFTMIAYVFFQNAPW
jgi:hypothetical protein